MVDRHVDGRVLADDLEHGGVVLVAQAGFVDAFADQRGAVENSEFGDVVA